MISSILLKDQTIREVDKVVIYARLITAGIPQCLYVCECPVANAADARWPCGARDGVLGRALHASHLPGRGFRSSLLEMARRANPCTPVTCLSHCLTPSRMWTESSGAAVRSARVCVGSKDASSRPRVMRAAAMLTLGHAHVRHQRSCYQRPGTTTVKKARL